MFLYKLHLRRILQNLIYPNIWTLKYHKLTLKNFFLKKEVICPILNLTLNWTVRG